MILEAAYRVCQSETGSLLLLSPIVGLPLILALALSGFVLFSIWRAPLTRGLAYAGKHRETIPTAVVTFTVLAAIWAGVSYRATILINSKIQQAYFETTLSVATSLALLLAVGLFAPLIWRLVGKFFQRFFFSLRPKVRGFTRLVVGLGFVAAAVILYRLAHHRADMLQRLPWVYVFPPVAALLVTLAFHKIGLLKKKSVYGALSLLVVGHLVFVFLPPDYASFRNTVNASPSLARLQLKTLIKASDVDRDGKSSIYMGQDCRPLDPEGGPSAYDIPDNGIDEDCDGLDSSAALLPKLGQNFHSIKKPAKLPNILLITTDALSYDHTTPGGYKHNVTPTLDKFAAQSTAFTRAYAVAPTTYMSMPMTQTGYWYPQIKITSGANNGGYPFGLSVDNETLATRLKALGYRTVFVPGQRYFGKENWPGLATGFDEVDMKGTTKFAHAAIPATNRVLAHLQEDSDKPVFIWVHYFDHHEPYFMPSGGKQFPVEEGPLGEKISKYNSEVERTDREWGRLFEYVEDQPVEDTIVIFTSDHGEAFDEKHLLKAHSHCIRASETHVPLYIQTPFQRGVKIDGLASHLDLVPTILNLLGKKPPDDMPGESLVPALVDGKSPEKQAVFVSFYDPRSMDAKKAFLQYGAQGLNYLYFRNQEDVFTSLTEATDPEGNTSIPMQNSGEPYMLKLYADTMFHKLQDKPAALFNLP